LFSPAECQPARNITARHDGYKARRHRRAGITAALNAMFNHVLITAPITH
jgi:hypothetical protein